MALTGEYPKMVPIKTFNENNGQIKSLCFLGNDLIASASDNNTICIWNVKTGTLLKSIKLINLFKLNSIFPKSKIHSKFIQD